MMVFGQGATRIDKNGKAHRFDPADINKLFYGDTDMNEGQIVEICKEQNGYSIEVKKPNGGFDTFVAENFGGAVKHIANAMNLTDEERNPPMIIMEHRRMGKSARMDEIMRSLRPGEAIEIAPTEEELRDEIGELRRKLKASEADRGNLSNALNLITGKFQNLEERYGSLRDASAKRERDLEKALEAAAKKTPPRKR